MVIAAAGDPGEAAARALADRDVCRVETLAAVREALGDATVVVVGDLAAGGPGDARDAARDAGVPVVGLGERGEGYDATADPDDVGAVRNAVDLAEQTAEYREAVDELYERSLAYAEGDSEDEGDLEAARDRAHNRLRDLRETTGQVPYENLLEPDDEADGDGDGDGSEDAGGGDGEGGSGDADGEDTDGGDATGR